MVSIIVLSYNTKELLRQCLTSIFAHVRGVEFEVIVVDNASRDGSGEMVRQQFKQVCLIVNSKNLGFSRGNNIGVDHAKGKYLLFLNSDTEVTDSTIAAMIDLLERDKRIGIAGGFLDSLDKARQQRCFGKFYNLPLVVLMVFGGDRFVRLKHTDIAEEVDWVSGGFMLIRHDLFKKLGGFDEHFFMYVEDMDLCWRAKKMGYKTYFYPPARVLHKGQGSSSREFAVVHIYRGLLYFYQKHRSYGAYLTLKVLLIAKALVALLVGILTNNFYLKNTYKRALSLSL